MKISESVWIIFQHHFWSPNSNKHSNSKADTNFSIPSTKTLEFDLGLSFDPRRIGSVPRPNTLRPKARSMRGAINTYQVGFRRGERQLSWKLFNIGEPDVNSDHLIRQIHYIVCVERMKISNPSC